MKYIYTTQRWQKASLNHSDFTLRVDGIVNLYVLTKRRIMKFTINSPLIKCRSTTAEKINRQSQREPPEQGKKH